ncbi:MAG: hypothetical protein WC897_04595 [Candidatus Gracilibacteria bacterium]
MQEQERNVLLFGFIESDLPCLGVPEQIMKGLNGAVFKSRKGLRFKIFKVGLPIDWGLFPSVIEKAVRQHEPAIVVGLCMNNTGDTQSVLREIYSTDQIGQLSMGGTAFKPVVVVCVPFAPVDPQANAVMSTIRGLSELVS